MIFYALLFLFTTLIILYMYYKHLGNRRKAEQELQDSFDNLKEAWTKFKGLF